MLTETLPRQQAATSSQTTSPVKRDAGSRGSRLMPSAFEREYDVAWPSELSEQE